MRGLPVLGRAPEIQGTQRWFNTPNGSPLSLRSLRGRVVLLDFWTYSCINCLRTLPELRSWDGRYRRAGLTIIGLHAPEFPFERDAGNVERAIARNELRYPVAQDNDFATWRAYGNQYWPAKYLIDARGRVRYAHFGEGEYEATERAIRALLSEAGRERLGRRASARVESPLPGATPESYLGAERAARFLNGRIEEGRHDFEPARRRRRRTAARSPRLRGPLAHRRVARRPRPGAAPGCTCASRRGACSSSWGAGHGPHRRDRRGRPAAAASSRSPRPASTTS